MIRLAALLWQTRVSLEGETGQAGATKQSV